MINKENFAKYVDMIKKLHDIEENINSVTNKLDWVISFAEHEQLIIDILKDSLNDQNGWIEYFIYELEFGTKWHPMCVTFNGEDIPMSSARDLYDVLIENMK